jgi:DNA repair protein RecO (recombination protein O)
MGRNAPTNENSGELVIRSIILKKQDQGEADELVVFLSRELGWLRGIAKNAKRSRVRFAGHLEPFSVVDLILRPRKKDDLVWIEESQVVKGFLGIRADIAKVARAAYFLELSSVFLPENNPDPVVFDFLESFLEDLEKSGLPSLRLMMNEIRLLGLLGYSPRFDLCPVCGQKIGPGLEGVFSPNLGGACHRECAIPWEPTAVALSPGTLALIRRALEMDEQKAARLKVSRRNTEELRAALSSFVRQHRGGEINSLAFLEATGL